MKPVTATEKQVQMTAQLYDMRKRARQLLGARYRDHMAGLGQILQQTAEQTKTSVLSVAIDVCKRRNLIGIELMMVMAAAVELVEPSSEDSKP